MSTKTKGTEVTEREQLPVEKVDYGTDWWVPKGFDDAARMAGLMAKSECVPSAYRNKPGDILAAWSLGAPLGLSLLSTLRFVTVINGVPSVWGDAAMAIVRAHPLCEYIHEEFEGQTGGDYKDGFEDDFTAVCSIKRRGDPKVVVRRFSVGDAKTAKLWMRKTNKGGDTPWVNYPKRMMQMRARSWAMRDSFPDALCGMPIAEEMRDITSDVRVVDAEPDTRDPSQKLLDHAKERSSSEARREKAEVEPAQEPEPETPTEESAEPAQEAPTLIETIEGTITAAKSEAHLTAIVDRMRDLYEEGRLHSSEQAKLTQACHDRGQELAKGRKR